MASIAKGAKIYMSIYYKKNNVNLGKFKRKFQNLHNPKAFSLEALITVGVNFTQFSRCKYHLLKVGVEIYILKLLTRTTQEEGN